MIIPDVNLLLYAVITGFPQHERARAWWEATVNGSAQIGLTTPAVFGFVRISTNGRIFESPLTVADAAQYVRTWLAEPNIVLLPPGANHVELALGLLENAGTADNLTTDAQLAAYAFEHKGEVRSNDTDFGRFPGLDWADPLAE